MSIEKGPTQQLNAQDNVRVIDSDNAAEMGRLLLQDKTVAEALGGYLPGMTPAQQASVQRVLDIACGPGGWALGVARSYPAMEVIGIDISPLMTTYATVQAEQQNLCNVRFEIMDALKPLEFPDETFDVVNIRLAFSFVPRTYWPTLIRECYRITRPGGTLLMTEADDLGMTSSAHYQEYARLLARALHQLNFGFSPDGYNFGMSLMVGRLFRDGGYQGIQHRADVCDFSYGAALYEGSLQNFFTLFQQCKPLLLAQELATEEDMERYQAKIQEDCHAETFRAITLWVTTWGHKPA